jgi:uncharacterized membrane protein
MPVKRVVFWGAIFALCMAISHLAFVLFAPRYRMAAIFNGALSAAPLNSMAVLDPGQQAKLFPDDTGAEIRAVCPFDLASGPLRIMATLPRQPWALSIYSPRGERIYTLGHEQAGANRIQVTVKKAQGLASIVAGGGETEINDGWTVESPDARGLAVVWLASDNPLLRARQAAVLKASTCALAPG